MDSLTLVRKIDANINLPLTGNNMFYFYSRKQAKDVTALNKNEEF